MSQSNRLNAAIAHEQTKPLDGPQASPPVVRLTLATTLGNKIYGAWWSRTELIQRELPQLTSLLGIRLGRVVDINVNWSSEQRQPDLYRQRRGVRPRTLTVGGQYAQARLIIPHRTGAALSVLLLRRAAGLPVLAAHRDSLVDQTAQCIVRSARGENAAHASLTRNVPAQAASRAK